VSAAIGEVIKWGARKISCSEHTGLTSLVGVELHWAGQCTAQRDRRKGRFAWERGRVGQEIYKRSVQCSGLRMLCQADGAVLR